MILAKSGLGYTGLWDVGGVEMSVDHLRRRSGDLHGELVILAAASPVLDGKLHRASFNLSSSQSRERLGKSLEHRSRIDVPWGDYLEEFCSTVLEVDRTGSPVMAVGALDAPEDEGYLVDPLLPTNKASIVFGAGGTGKSYFAVLTAVCVASGHGLFDWPTGQGGVLYLDWETDEFEIDSRIKRVSAGLGIPVPKNIFYRACARSLDDMAEYLAKIITDNDIRLVIADSVGMAAGPAREHSGAEEGAISLFAAFRYLGVTVLAIDHVTGADAGAERAVHKPYGSIYKMNLARSVWELKGSVEDGATLGHLGLFHRKVNRGALSHPYGIRVEHFDEQTTFALEEITDETPLVKSLSYAAQVSRALKQGALTVSEIATETGIAEGAVRTTLTRSQGRLFTHLMDGRWGLMT